MKADSAPSGEETVEPNSGKPDHGPTVTFKVNNNPVTMRGSRVTGLEIKQAAIEQGGAIQIDFVLSEIKNGKYRIVGDADEITINKNSEFAAVAPDDNS